MSGIFDGVHFYVIPETAQRLQKNNEAMISLLKNGKGTEIREFGHNVSHAICTSADYNVIKQKAKDSSFSCFVTPKWVFISQSLQYTVSYVRF